jgi:NADP-dependent 3-hydroxy acid dehydrogenase YdfG
MTASTLRGLTCVVTGASSGIGRAIAVSLASAGATVWTVARRRAELEAAAAQAAGAGAFVPYEADLVADGQVATLARRLRERREGVDILVHSAGTISLGTMETASIDDLDRQYAANVRAPYLLTQMLLPDLRATQGQIVFINSTATQSATATTGQFAATQHALKAIADALRNELNPDGVRVLSVYPGRTATDRQASIHAAEGKDYRPEHLLQPEDVAAVVLHALTLPRTAELTDVTVRPMRKH